MNGILSFVEKITCECRLTCVEGIVFAHLQCANWVNAQIQTFHVWLPSTAAARLGDEDSS